MEIIVLSFLIVILPLAIAGFISMWREHRDKKLTEESET
jgi:hypothetical protein